jgi:fumarate reductase subunit D
MDLAGIQDLIAATLVCTVFVLLVVVAPLWILADEIKHALSGRGVPLCARQMQGSDKRDRATVAV